MKKKALVVDNDFFFVEFLTELLEERNYTVIKAYDGKEGISSLEAETVDIIFADLVMPKVDGWQLIKHIRNRFTDHPFPVVAVSGTVIERLEDLSKIGADYYIAKGPMEKMTIQFREFMDKIESQPLPEDEEKLIIGMEELYPRRESIELIQSLQFQRSILDSIGLGIIVVDHDGKVLSTNARALSILDLGDAEVFNRKIPEIFRSREKNVLIKAMKKIAESNFSDTVTVNLSIDTRQIHLTVSLLIFEEKKCGWIIAMEDV